jgi:uncharacterized repeat protein (TIGR03803 family)
MILLDGGLSREAMLHCMICYKFIRFLCVVALLFAGGLALRAQTAAPLPASENLLYIFGATATDARYPSSAPMTASDGNMYGVTADGGTSPGYYGTGAGTLYRRTPQGKITVLYNFTGGNDGGGPYNTPLEGSDGNLYGTTNYYGAHGTYLTGGTIYRYNLKTGVLTTLYAFAHGGGASFADLIDDGKGTLYGTANLDDPSGKNLGGIWSYNYLTNTFKTLHTFSGADGECPLGGVVLASDGNLYGTTEWGGVSNDPDAGQYGDGTAFVIGTDGSNFHVIHDFSNGEQGVEDGAWPSSTLVAGLDGNLYSMTFQGGLQGNGTGVFYRIVPKGTDSTFESVYSFKSGDANNPLHGRPYLGGDGNFYIAGSEGGLYTYYGQVMQIDPIKGLTADVYDFNPAAGDGFSAESSPMEGPDGNLYGTVPFGGTNSDGDLYELQTTLPPAISLTADSNAIDNIANGGSVTLEWQVTNAFSPNAKVCYASSPDGSWTGLLTGTSGTATVTPTASDSLVLYAVTCGGIETATAQVVVGTIPPQIETGTLPGGVTRSPYTQKIVELGGVAPLKWSVTSGSLPDGIALNTSTGVLSGTPTTPGSFPFTVRVTDSESTPKSATVNLSINVVHAPLVTPGVTLTVTPQSIALGATPTLTATVNGIAGVPTPTGTVQFSANGSSIGAPVTLDASSGTATATITSLVPSSTGTFGIAVAYSGDSNYTPGNIATGALTVTAPSTAAITASPTTITVTAPGASGATTLHLANFPAGTISLTCAGLPTGAQCVFGTPSAGTNGGSTAKLSITTTAGTRSAIASSRNAFYALVLPGMLALAGLRRRRRISSVLLALLLMLPFAAALTACGGSKPPVTPTPAGTSAITVTATTGSQSATIGLTLEIQ